MTINYFSHRGFSDKSSIKPNTIKAFRNAYKKGYRALEFDIWFIKNQLVLAHNKPKKIEEVFFKQGTTAL